MNIVQVLMKLLAGDAGQQLAKALGLTPDKLAAALQSILPAILAALSGAASTKDGARRLASAVEAADDDYAGSLLRQLKDPNSTTAGSGPNQLESLLPEGLLAALKPILQQLSGLNAASLGTLVSSLLPMILGFLKRETQASGFDPSSLTKFLDSQKSNIAQAMPQELTAALASAPGLSSMASLVGNTATDAARQVTQKSQQVVAATTSPMTWLVPALAALAVGVLLWNSLQKPALPPAVVNKERTEITAPAETSQPLPADTTTVEQTVTAAKLTPAMAEQVETATKSVETWLTDVTRLVTGITDADAAKSAAEALPAQLEQFAQAKQLVQELPESFRTPIQEQVAKAHGTLQKLVEKLAAVPGVNEAVAPQLESLLMALKAFSD